MFRHIERLAVHEQDVYRLGGMEGDVSARGHVRGTTDCPEAKPRGNQWSRMKILLCIAKSSGDEMVLVKQEGVGSQLLQNHQTTKQDTNLESDACQRGG